MTFRSTFARFRKIPVLTLAGIAMVLGWPAQVRAQADTTAAAMVGKFGSFVDAKAFSISGDGRMTVVDGGAGSLIMLGPDGSVERTLNGKGWGELGFDQPCDVDATQTIRIYVADEGNHRIQTYDRSFNFVSTLDGELPADDGYQFRYPLSVAMSRHNDIFILDGDNGRIVKLNSSGTIAAAFGGFDAGRGRLEAPSRIRISTNDILAVIDGEDLVFFDLYGNYLTRYRNSEKIAACTPVDQSMRWMIASDSTVVVIEQGETGCTLLGRVEMPNEDAVPVKVPAIRDISVCEKTLYLLTDHGIIRLSLSAWQRLTK